MTGSSGPGDRLERLLIVTDDPGVQGELKYGFRAATEVELAVDAREARALMTETVPSAVVVDLQTGSAGGFALARDMSEDARLANVPIIMLLERPQDGWLAQKAGALAYLVKPVTAEQVISALPQFSAPA